jgi:hypothetical protein
MAAMDSAPIQVVSGGWERSAITVRDGRKTGETFLALPLPCKGTVCFDLGSFLVLSLSVSLECSILYATKELRNERQPASKQDGRPASVCCSSLHSPVNA